MTATDVLPDDTSNGWHEIEQAISANYERLGPAQRRAIDLLLSDTRYAAMSASELAREVGINESTVTRAAQVLGFSGYPDLRSRLRRRLLSNVPGRVHATMVDLAESADTVESAAIRAILDDAASLRATANDLVAGSLSSVVDALAEAERVLIFGSRGSYGIATILAIELRLLRRGTLLLSQGAGDLPDQLVDLSERDAVLVLSLQRVDRVAVDVLRAAANAGARSIAITDHHANPVARLSTHTLVARMAPLRLLPSYASMASLANALTTMVALRLHGGNPARLSAAERLWREMQTHAET